MFAFPSVKEGFGLAALEALAAGLPVVASDLDVFRGFLADGESALLTPAGDAAALGARRWRASRSTRRCATRLRAGGRRVVAASTRWDAAAAAHERAYEAFLASGRWLTRWRSPPPGTAATRRPSRRAGTGSRSTSRSTRAARTAA